MSRSALLALAWALIFALHGCSAYELADGGTRGPPMDDDDDWDDDDAGDDDAGCVIVGTVPVDGDPTVYYRDALQVFFAEPVSAANVTLEDDAVTIPGVTTLAEDGLSASFDPFGDDPSLHLVPQTSYHASVDAPGCSADWAFTTSDLGVDLHGSVVFEEARYLVHLDQATLAEPAGMAPLLEPFGLTAFLLSVDEVEAGELSLKAGGMVLDQYGQPTQDLCTVTMDLTPSTPASLTGAHLTLPPTDLTLTVDLGLYLELLSFSLDAEFTQAGDWIEEGRLGGWIDGFALDQILEVLGGEPVAGTCQTLEQLGSPCEACPGSPEQLTCIHFVWQDVRGEFVGMNWGLADVAEEDLQDCGE